MPPEQILQEIKRLKEEIQAKVTDIKKPYVKETLIFLNGQFQLLNQLEKFIKGETK